MMGATTFETYAKGSDVRDAFSNAVEAARFEYGHGGYSGSIAEKGSYTVLSTRPMSYEKAQSVANRLMDASDPRIDDKWGPAGALPVDEDGSPSRSTTVTVTIPGGLDWDERDKALAEAANKKVRLKAGEKILDVRAHGMGKATKAVVKSVPTKGKIVTRYVVSGTHHNVWERGFASQAEARAAAIRLAEASSHQTLDLEVSSVSRRENGDPLVRVVRSTPKVEVEVTVTVDVPPAAGYQPKTTGWLFFGWASE